MRAIDLFAGCGGFSVGFLKAGYTITKALEFDQTIASTYAKNHCDVEIIVDDIKNIDAPKVFPRKCAEVIVGGPPCQGFSMAGARIRRGFIDDPRDYLFKHYFEVVKSAQPLCFVMENVKGMTTAKGGEIFEEIQKMFSSPSLLDGLSYQLYPRLIKANEFGVPQKRERLIIVGTKIKNIDFDFLWDQTRCDILKNMPHYFDFVTVKDAIGNLPQVTPSGRIAVPIAETDYEKFIATNRGHIENHTKSNHSQVAIDRMKRIATGENYTVLSEKINSVHSGAYGRLCWDEQAPTITTRFDTPAGGRFIHPEENRTLSPREAARIQSFPDDFVFYGDKRSISRQIGNAVPPKVAYFFAKLIMNIIQSLGREK